MLVFCAASEARLAELRTAVRQHLAWKSILEDHEIDRLELTKGDEGQANSKLSETDETINRRIFETFAQVLVPEQTAGTKDIIWHVTKPSGSGSLAERVARKLEAEERLILQYGGVRVRMDLDRIPLWTKRGDITVEKLWDAYCQFPYLPRLGSFEILAAAISNGTSSLSWAEETFAYAEAFDDGRWLNLVTGQMVNARPSGLIVSPEAAQQQIQADREAEEERRAAGREGGTGSGDDGGGPSGDPSDLRRDGGENSGITDVADQRTYYAQFTLDPVRAIGQLDDILTNMVNHLNKASDANIEISLEINATSEGFDERVRRIVKENGGQLGAKGNEFE